MATKKRVGGARKKTVETITKRLGRPPKELKKLGKETWDEFILMTTKGTKRAVALEALQITKYTYDAYLISHVTAVEQVRRADQIWLRRNWPLEQIEEILVLIAMGKTMKQAGELLFLDNVEMVGLYRILLKDPQIRKLYDEAREMQAEAWADDTIDIADDGRNDTYIKESRNGTEYEAVNFDNIQRSKLRVDSRRWIMARLHHQRFGDRIKQDIEGSMVVNHADQLTAARQRMEKAHKQRKKLGTGTPGNVVDKTITDLPPTKSTH